MRVKIQDLSPVCVTRRRGADAFEALMKLDDGSNIEIDLNGTEMLSLSFLDELIYRLHQKLASERVAFVTSSPNHLAKLGRISGYRKIAVRRVVNGTPENVPPTESPALDMATVEETDPGRRR